MSIIGCQGGKIIMAAVSVKRPMSAQLTFQPWSAAVLQLSVFSDVYHIQVGNYFKRLS